MRMTLEQRVSFLENKVTIVEKENDELRCRIQTLSEDPKATSGFPPGFKLTKIESEILYYMMSTGRLISHRNYMHAIPSYSAKVDSVPDSKVLDVFICKLRIKLNKVGLRNIIVTKWGLGYYIDPDQLDKLKEKYSE